MRAVSIFPLAFLLVLSPASLLWAQGSPPVDLQALEARLVKLEQELERQRREVEDLRAQLARARAAKSAPAPPERAPARVPSEAEVRGLLAKSKLGAALKAARARLVAKPGATSRTLLAEVLLAEGDQEGAAAQLRETLRLAPAHSRAICFMAEIMMAQGDLEQARHSLDRLIEVEAGFAEAYSLRGRARIRQRPRPDMRGAIMDLSKAIELDPSLGSAYFQRGVAHYETHRFEDAVKDLSRALELGGRGVSIQDGRYILAFAHFYLEKYEVAISHLEWFLENAPSTHRGRKHAAKFLAKARAKR